MKKTKQIEKNAKIVNKYLNSKLKGNPKKLYDAAGHLIVNGGKRLRPYMVIKSDDIMDNDEMRHGVPTVHKKFGMPIAILAGDVLFSKAFQIISESKLSPNATTHLISRLAKACVDVCEGQLLDIKMADEKRVPAEAEYITMIGKKTAALFDVSCAMGAICATNKPKDISNLSEFGRNLGIAFQITDDLIGVMGDPKVTKKPVGNDLREGKKSLPILMAIKLAKSNERKIILKAFGNTKISKKDLSKAVEVIRSLGIEEKVRNQALKYAEKSEKSLTKYKGTAKVELTALLDFVVRRSV
jgi:geranylgeranyl diphosphate synthase type I